MEEIGKAVTKAEADVTTDLVACNAEAPGADRGR